MKNFFVFTIILFFIVILSSCIKRNFNHTFFSRSHTNMLKGFAILTVLWGHIGSAYNIPGIQWVAGIGVSLFLICSGYGLEASYSKNGLKSFWSKRFWAVIVPYWIIYLFAAGLMSDDFNFSMCLRILLFIQANWYVRYILIIYIIYWILKKAVIHFELQQSTFYLFLFSTFVVWFVVESLFFAKATAPSLLARQMFAFPLGVVIFDHYDWIKLQFNSKNIKNQFMFGLIAVISLFVLVFSQANKIESLPYILSNTLSLFTVMPLALVVIKLSCLFKPLFYNQSFNFLGSISYEVYLIQYFSRQIVNTNASSIYICFVFTLLISWIFKVAYNYFNKARIKSKNAKSNLSL